MPITAVKTHKLQSYNSQEVCGKNTNSRPPITTMFKSKDTEQISPSQMCLYAEVKKSINLVFKMSGPTHCLQFLFQAKQCYNTEYTNCCKFTKAL